MRDLGTVRVGVAVRDGLPKPDVSTVEAFRAALVAARSVAYTDPAAGGTAGSHFAAVIEKLGLTEELAGKRHLALDGLDVMRKVKAAKSISASRRSARSCCVDRATYAGPLPEAVQVLTIYSVFVPATADPVDRAFADGAHQRRRARAIRRRGLRVTR